MRQVAPAEKMTEYVGTDLGYSDWFQIDQSRIDGFADVTLDHQYIHVDPERAALTPFGTTIAHGFLTVSLLVHLSQDLALVPENAVMGINYGINKLRFLAPVKVGSRIRAHSTVADVVEKTPGQFLITYDVTVEIEDEEKPALVAQWLSMAIVAP